jgi:hypothetical protein
MGNAHPRYGGSGAGSGAVSERVSEGVSGARLRLSGGVDYWRSTSSTWYVSE